MGGQVKKGLPKPDIVSYALEVSVNGVMCVFVVHFKSSEHIKNVVIWLNS